MGMSKVLFQRTGVTRRTFTRAGLLRLVRATYPDIPADAVLYLTRRSGRLVALGEHDQLVVSGKPYDRDAVRRDVDEDA
jgi:hypothetical protein